MTVVKPFPAPGRYEQEIETGKSHGLNQPQPVEISVVLPCLNEEAAITKCIASIQDVLDEVGKPYEIIVADNGSTDGSVQRAGAAGAEWCMSLFADTEAHVGPVSMLLMAVC